MSQVSSKAVDRVDGRLKVTGQARYPAETQIANVAYSALVLSTIPKGRVTRLDTRAAESAPGVLRVFTYREMPKLGRVERFPVGSAGQSFMPMQDDRIHYAGQFIAFVIAETSEQAGHAASLVRASYEEEPAVATLADALARSYVPGSSQPEGQPTSSAQGGSTKSTWKPEPKSLDKTRGNAEQALPRVFAQVDSTYTTPVEHHNPIEAHTTIAAWEGERLTIYEPTQWVLGAQRTLATQLGIPQENIRVVSHFVGGAFGCKAFAWAHVTLAAIAARSLRRPVKLTLIRKQMYTSNGYRPATVQRVRLGADREGKLTAILHDTTGQTSPTDDFVEGSLPETTQILYACPNVAVTYRLARVNASTPTVMRAPGESTGVFALDSAMDELAYMLADGSALAQCGTHDLGTGAYTAMAIVAAETLGLPVERVRIELGDSDLPKSPVAGGSRSTASVGAAVRAAAAAVRGEAIRLALADRASPLYGATEADISTANGRLFPTRDSLKGETYAELLKRHGSDGVEAYRETLPPGGTGEDKLKTFMGLNATRGSSDAGYAMDSFGAQFCEVKIDPDLGAVRVTRFVGAFGAGRIINRKTAESQLRGGIVGGIGMALMEETITDRKRARIVNANLGEYHVPVHADVPQIDAFFVDEEDSHIGPLGAKGVGEIGIVGVAAAVANAVFHATGKRIRELPITLDKLL